jgi:hypothetical protein
MTGRRITVVDVQVPEGYAERAYEMCDGSWDTDLHKHTETPGSLSVLRVRVPVDLRTDHHHEYYRRAIAAVEAVLATQDIPVEAALPTDLVEPTTKSRPRRLDEFAEPGDA